jgi:hypothetical protein
MGILNIRGAKRAHQVIHFEVPIVPQRNARDRFADRGQPQPAIVKCLFERR